MWYSSSWWGAASADYGDWSFPELRDRSRVLSAGKTIACSCWENPVRGGQGPKMRWKETQHLVLLFRPWLCSTCAGQVGQLRLQSGPVLSTLKWKLRLPQSQPQNIRMIDEVMSGLLSNLTSHRFKPAWVWNVHLSIRQGLHPSPQPFLDGFPPGSTDSLNKRSFPTYCLPGRLQCCVHCWGYWQNRTRPSCKLWLI